MCRKGQTVMFNGVPYRLTMKGRIYAGWLIFVDWFKRRRPVVRYYQRKYPTNSTCYNCGLPWEAVRESKRDCGIHFIDVDEDHGFFPCCEYCWQRMDDLKKIDAIVALFEDWESCGGSPYTEEEMLDALAQDLQEKQA